jgi:hypothetical protein
MTGLRFQCSDACNVPDATADGSDAADAGDAADAADGGRDGPAQMIDADAAGADSTLTDGAAPSDSSTADITGN